MVRSNLALAAGLLLEAGSVEGFHGPLSPVTQLPGNMIGFTSSAAKTKADCTDLC